MVSLQGDSKVRMLVSSAGKITQIFSFVNHRSVLKHVVVLLINLQKSDGDIFTIEVEHNGGNQTFEGELKQFGFSHKFFIRVTGIDLIFEPDEERNLRAIVPGDASVDKVLVQKIMQKLEKGLK